MNILKHFPQHLRSDKKCMVCGARSGQGYRAPAYRGVPGPTRGRWTRIASVFVCEKLRNSVNLIILSPPAAQRDTFGGTRYLTDCGKIQNLQQRMAMFRKSIRAVSGPKRERGAKSGQGYRAPAYRVVPGPARGRWTRIASVGLCMRSCESPWIGDKFITA